MALDKFQQLVSECPIALAFLGNPKQGTLELAWVSPENVPDFVQRGDFIGMVGLSGTPPRMSQRALFAVEIDYASVSALAKSVAALLKAAITETESGVSTNLFRH